MTIRNLPNTYFSTLYIAAGRESHAGIIYRASDTTNHKHGFASLQVVTLYADSNLGILILMAISRKHKPVDVPTLQSNTFEVAASRIHEIHYISHQS